MDKTVKLGFTVFLSLACLALGLEAPAASPPGLVNYQGVLRDASGAPLTGGYDMTFTFYSANSGGDQILVDTHAGGSQIGVNGGLFTTALGSGTVTDGTGPGTYTDLGSAFRDYGTVYVEIVVGGETLNQRVRVVSSAYALNADNLDGLDSASFSPSSHNHTGTYLPLAGGTMAGNIAFSGSQTVDGVDLSASATNWNSAFTHSTAASNVHGLTFTSEGAGGGLDADTLDGQHASAFMVSGTDNWVNIAGDTMTGKLTLATTADTALSANVTSSNTLAWLQNAGSGYPLYAQTTYASGSGSLVPGIVGVSSGASTNGENVGVQGTGQGSATTNYGGKFFGMGNSGTKYGVYGYAGGSNENRAGYFWAKQAGAANNYAVYAEASGATNNYAGYFSGPVSVTGGKLSTAASSTSGAGLNLPHGTAPSSPVNGDIWTTTGGLYAQINSSTLGPFITTSISDHGLLTGLSDDDHHQYFALSQSETVSGIPAFNGGTTGAAAPFSVDSTFLVSNLNADLLDGQHASAFAVSGHAHSTLTRGTGLSGSNYDGSAPTTFAVVYGTSAGTAVQGNQAATITAGSGLTGGVSSDVLGDGLSATLNVGAGSGIAVAADSVSLGPLTAEWNQTGAFDISLNSASSELKMLESAGATYFGTLDVGDLSADATYTFGGASGTVLTTGNDGAGSGLDADLLDGQHGSYYLNTSSIAQTKTGKVTLNASSGDYGVEAYGPTAGGYFKDSTGTGYCYAGTADIGIQGHGDNSGGIFYNSAAGGTAWAYLARRYNDGMADGGYGVWGGGNLQGGRFEDTDSSGVAYLATGDQGITAFGNTEGGYFADSNSTGTAHVGYGNYGIYAGGSTAGGFFNDTTNSGYAYVGYGDRGIYAIGNNEAGYFKTDDGTGTAEAMVADRQGTASPYNYIGVRGYGNTAGAYFKDTDASGYAWLGIDDCGIQANGNEYAGYFENTAAAMTYAYIANQYAGIEAYGGLVGGYFTQTTSGNYANVATDVRKIYGNGSVAFVQNHPSDIGMVIVYNAPEGDEVATYTRGSARLVNGEARVKLGETFAWVTNPDIGLTAHLTPRGEAAPLAVRDLSTTELVVTGPSDVAFDYIVYGLRIGFEEVAIVQPKEEESYIPSMNRQRTIYEGTPSLRGFNALERYKAGRTEMGVAQPLDLSRATALKEAIHEFQPGVDLPPSKAAMRRGSEGAAGSPSHGEVPRSSPSPVPASDPPSSPVTGRGEPDLPAAAAIPERARADRFPICEPVQEGDVLTNAPEHPGAFCLTKVMSDPGVVGVAVADTAGSEGARARAESPYGTAPVATSGVALCKADATLGPIAANDLLCAAPFPGHAMRAPRPIEPGTVIGKALEPLESGTGLIKVLVMLR